MDPTTPAFAPPRTAPRRPARRPRSGGVTRAGVGAALLLAGLSACVPTTRQPAPPPVQQRPVSPPPSLPAPPPVADWTLAPLTPGTWTYAASNGGGVARYAATSGTDIAALACDRGSRTLRWRVAGPEGQPLVLRTTFGARSVAPGGVAAGDRLWDELAFSRGRFRIDPPSGTPVILPAWPELARVIEDCRR